MPLESCNKCKKMVMTGFLGATCETFGVCLNCGNEVRGVRNRVDKCVVCGIPRDDTKRGVTCGSKACLDEEYGL